MPETLPSLDEIESALSDLKKAVERTPEADNAQLVKIGELLAEIERWVAQHRGGER